MKIGIIGAMEEEIILLYNKIKNCQIISWNKIEIYIGQLNNIEIALMKSGIGKVAATLGTLILLKQYKPNLIINIGSAGALISTLNIGDIVVANENRYHDVDATIFGYEYGQIPGYPAAFKANKNLINITEECSSKLNLKLMRGLIVSGDTFIDNNIKAKKIYKYFPKAIAVEMESTAIAHVCYNFNIPFLVIRAISDIVTDSKFNFCLNIAAKQSFLLVDLLIKKIANI